MTQDEIIRMAREAGVIAPEEHAGQWYWGYDCLERFAALVAEAEREKIALAYKTRPRGKSKAPHMIAAYRAMQMALDVLEALKNTNSYWWQEVHESDLNNMDKAITALREALAQHPMDYNQGFVDGVEEGLAMAQPQDNLNCKSVQKRLATSWGYVKTPVSDYDREFWGDKPQGSWVDLTDDEVDLVIDETYGESPELYVTQVRHDFANEVIAKFKEKNTPPVVPQEPVANDDPYNGDDGYPFDEHFHAQLLAGAHLLKDEEQTRFIQGWNACREFMGKNTPPSVEAAIEATKEKAANTIHEMAKLFQIDYYEAQTLAAAIRSMK